MTVDARPDVIRLSTAQLRSQVRDLVAQWRAEHRFAPRCDSWLRSYDPAFTKELAKRGLIGMTWPRRYGGGEYSNGDFLFCLGLSEPEAGSDLAAVRTSAERVDGGWLITGRKVWTSGAHYATHCYVLARTEKSDKKHVGLSEFVVDMTAPGIAVTPIVDMAGEHHFNETVFDHVFVPEGNLIGVEGQGWRQVVEQLSFERGGPERVLSTYPLLTQMLERSDRIRELGLRREIGVLIARLATLRRLCWDVAREMDNGASTIVQAATLKMLGNVFERDVISVARDVLGGPGSSPQSPYGQALLASPGFSLRGGAADVLLSIIAKQEARP